MFQTLLENKKNTLTKIVLVLITTLSLCYADNGPYQSRKFFTNNGGLLNHISPLLIPEKNASTLMNITMDDRGQLTKRNGYTILNSTGSLSLTSPTLGGGYHNSATGSAFFAVVIGTSVYQTGNTFNSVWTNISSVTITNSSSNLVQTTSLEDKLIFCDESDKPFTYTSGNSTVLSISTNTFDAAKTCSTYGSYLVVGNTTESGTNYNARVRWSDVNNTESFPVLNYTDVEPQDGDKIVSIVGFQDSTYIFKHHTIYQMVITGLDGPDAFIIRPVARNIGAWAKNSVKVIPGLGVAFLAQNTVYLLSGNSIGYGTQASGTSYGVQLQPIGDAIQRTFDGIQRSQWTNAVAEVYPQRYQYWLAVSTSSTSNQEVLVYDYIQQAWSIYSGMSVNTLSQAETSTGNNILISGDYNGNVYQQDNGTSDNPKNITTAIAASYTTPWLTMDDPDYTKNFKYLYIFSQVNSSTTVQEQNSYDFNSVIESSNAISLGATGAVYDTAIYDQDIYPSNQYKVSRVELNRDARSMQITFSNSDANAQVGVIGWTIVYKKNDWTSL